MVGKSGPSYPKGETKPIEPAVNMVGHQKAIQGGEEASEVFFTGSEEARQANVMVKVTQERNCYTEPLWVVVS